MSAPLMNSETHDIYDIENLRAATTVTAPTRPVVNVDLANDTYLLYADSGSSSETEEQSEMDILQSKVLYFIYLDSAISFLYLFMNPFFGVYAGFNLLFSYIGYSGVKKYESTYLGTYTLYNIFRMIGMIIFYCSVLVNHEKVFGNGENSEDSYIVFAICYTCLILLYAYFIRKTFQLIHLFV
jgi:hypothetical protein